MPAARASHPLPVDVDRLLGTIMTHAAEGLPGEARLSATTTDG